MSSANYSNINSVSIANSIGSGTRAPILIPEEYKSWVGRMNLHLNSISEDVWKCVDGSLPDNMTSLTSNLDILNERKKLELQAKKELVSGIPHSILSQMNDIILLTANQIWQTLKNRFEGNERIIGNKKTSVLNEFDNFKMFSHETIHDAHDRFNLITIKMNNLGIKKSQHEINLKFLNNLYESWKMVKLIIQGNPVIHTESLYNLYGELQSYESSIDPPTSTSFGGPLALLSTSSQNQTHFPDQSQIDLNQNQAFLSNPCDLSDPNNEADYHQLCALVANTNLERFLPHHRPNFQQRSTFGQNFQNRGFQNNNNSYNQNNGFQNNQNSGFQQNHSKPSQQKQTQTSERPPVKSQKADNNDDDDDVIICHKCKGLNHYARDCRAKIKVKDSAYYAQKAEELKKQEKKAKQKALMAFHEPSVEYWPTSDDETDTEPAQSNFCFMADNEPTTRAPYVIDQVWSMISDLGLSRTSFESHMTKIENSLKADLRLYHDTIVKSDIYKSELQTLQLRFGESTRTRDKLERDIERKSEENNHILEQLNEALKQKRDLEIKNQSVISSEIKDTLEKEVLQLKQKVQDLTDNNTSLILKLEDSSKQIKFLESENQRFQGKLDSINIARKLSDDVFTKANNLGTGKIDTNYKPGIGRESFENEETEKKNGKICENSQPDFFSSTNEDDSDDETVINCSPDDTAFTVSKMSFKRVLKSESDSASSVTHQLRSTKLTMNDGTIKLENFLNGENSDHQNGSTSAPTVFPSLNSTLIGKNNLGQKYSKKQQTNKQTIQAVCKPKEQSRPIVFKEKPLKPSAAFCAGEPKDGTWYIDSGCSKHMTGNQSFLRDFKPTESKQDVTFGNNMTARIKGYGNITNGHFTIKKVAYVDGLKHNLISVSQLCDNNHEVLFTKQRSIITDAKTKAILVNSDRLGNMYPLDMDLIYGKPDICLLSKASADISWLWHRRLSHLNFGYINKLIANDLVRGLPLLKLDNETLCAACEGGKLCKSSHKSIPESSVSEPLELLHIDLCGPAKTQSIKGKKYILVIIDDYSRFTWVFFLRLKSEAPEEMINFIKQIELKLKRPVRRIRSDNGSEFKNITLDSFLKNKGIEHNFSAPYTPQQNGVVERKNRTLCEAARSMLIFADLPQYFWAEAIATACYTQNRSLIHKQLHKTPYEVINNRKPNIKFFHIFGCRCFIKNNKDHLSKFESRSDEGIFLGYSFTSAAYRVLNKRTRVIEQSTDIHFDEFYVRKLDRKHFGSKMIDNIFQNPIQQIPSTDIEIDLDLLFEQPKTAYNSEFLTSSTFPTGNSDAETSQSNQENTDQVEGELPTPNPSLNTPNPSVQNDPSASSMGEPSLPHTHPIIQKDISDNNQNLFPTESPDQEEQWDIETPIEIPEKTRLNKWTRNHPADQIIGDPNSGIQTRAATSNECLYGAFLSMTEPKTIHSALKDPDWVKAMQEELAEFERNQVWDLVPTPPDVTVVGSRWVFRNKTDDQGILLDSKPFVSF
ncbi:hypothetical protein L2E82_38363 [Cichorium intybus]|uniref:Uncharacterized protein n=1 Tax=Cichorium intybus TaxID=13427 RepID=A0ACB9AGT8_CICIN|nr:hypothetical protein L2E82_38363 [Cichorium intybus]